jgi:nucleoside-diphosphate-sugar epimerase
LPHSQLTATAREALDPGILRGAEVSKILITGGAGLVGQNLIPRLMDAGFGSIVVIDKAAENSGILRKLHPGIKVVDADLADGEDWQQHFVGVTVLICAHAQIGGLERGEFVRNNIDATRRVIEAAKAHGVSYVVNISSSVVNSMARDHYTETKAAQEEIVAASGIAQVILRPTLMFGWFDRKHVGWLARFMQRLPLFPVPGSGKFLRQPLYAGDFCDIIVSAIGQGKTGAFNISGQERIWYIDLMREVRRACGSKALIVRIPFWLFSLLLRIYAVVDRNPPFTVKQLKALATPDIFEVIDWPGIFGVRATPLGEALDQTFRDPVYSAIELKF